MMEGEDGVGWGSSERYLHRQVGRMGVIRMQKAVDRYAGYVAQLGDAEEGYAGFDAGVGGFNFEGVGQRVRVVDGDFTS